MCLFLASPISYAYTMSQRHVLSKLHALTVPKCKHLWILLTRSMKYIQSFPFACSCVEEADKLFILLLQRKPVSFLMFMATMSKRSRSTVPFQTWNRLASWIWILNGVLGGSQFSRPCTFILNSLWKDRGYHHSIGIYLYISWTLVNTTLWWLFKLSFILYKISKLFFGIFVH